MSIAIEGSRYFVVDSNLVIHDVKLPGQKVIKSGTLYGDLNFTIQHQEKLEWRRLSSIERASRVVVEGTQGLLSLAERCAGDDPSLGIINYFRGVSHLVSPIFLERLGFSVKRPRKDLETEVRTGIRRDLADLYGQEAAERMRVGKIWEFWATREQLVASLPMLHQAASRLQRRRSK